MCLLPRNLGVLGQEPSPVLEGVVGGHAEGSAFVGGDDKAERQLGAGVVQRCEPDLIDQDDVVAQQASMVLPDGLSASPR